MFELERWIITTCILHIDDSLADLARIILLFREVCRISDCSKSQQRRGKLHLGLAEGACVLRGEQE